MTALCRYGIRAAVFIGLAGCFLQFVFFAFEVHPPAAALEAAFIAAMTVPGIVIDRRRARSEKKINAADIRRNYV